MYKLVFSLFYTLNFICLQVTVNEDNVEKFPNYNLYLYGEGSYYEKLKNLDLKGIPVLYIPGNAGSYKQVSFK